MGGACGFTKYMNYNDDALINCQNVYVEDESKICWQKTCAARGNRVNRDQVRGPSTKEAEKKNTRWSRRGRDNERLLLVDRRNEEEGVAEEKL